MYSTSPLAPLCARNLNYRSVLRAQLRDEFHGEHEGRSTLAITYLGDYFNAMILFSTRSSTEVVGFLLSVSELGPVSLNRVCLGATENNSNLLLVI